MLHGPLYDAAFTSAHINPFHDKHIFYGRAKLMVARYACWCSDLSIYLLLELEECVRVEKSCMSHAPSVWSLKRRDVRRQTQYRWVKVRIDEYQSYVCVGTEVMKVLSSTVSLHIFLCARAWSEVGFRIWSWFLSWSNYSILISDCRISIKQKQKCLYPRLGITN